jgi:Ion channel
MALLPLLSDMEDGRIALSLMNSLVLVGGTLAVARTSRQTRVAVVLAAVCMPLQWLAIVAPNELLIAVVESAMAVFYGHTVVVLLAFVLRPGAVGADRMYAAVSVYILLGFFWALGYYALEHRSAAAFATTVTQLSGQRFVYGDLLYFSFVTLTSTGYGDIVPVSQGARSLAVFEHIAGVMYIAILIARLAGLYSSDQSPRSR